MEIKAAVWDNVTGDAIPSASVLVVNSAGQLTTTGAVANATGEFDLTSSLLDQPGYRLQITSAGYQGVLVDPYLLLEDGGVGLERGGDLAPVVVTAHSKKKIPGWWYAAGLGLVALLIYMASKKKALGAMQQKDWIDLALKVGIAAGLFFVVVVPILKKLGLWGQSDQAAQNQKAIDDSLQQVTQTGGTQGTLTKTAAEYNSMANTIYTLAFEDPIDQAKIRNVVIECNTLADWLSLMKAFGTRKGPATSWFSLCSLASVNCPEVDLPTFLKQVIPDQIGTINSSFSATHINYAI